MATATVSHVMVANTTALASEANTNFTNLLTFLNTDVIHVDGSKSMTGELTLSGAPTTNNSAARKLYVDDSVAAAVPPGIITPYAGTTAPTGYLLCYGQAVSRTTYAALFAITSTTYGVGDGSTTFNVPDLRGRVGIGLDNMGGSDAARVGMANTLGGGGGSHTHSTTGASTGGTSGGVSAWHTHRYSAGSIFEADTLNPSSNHTHYTSVNYTAPSTAADVNLPPYLLLNYLIKT